MTWDAASHDPYGSGSEILLIRSTILSWADARGAAAERRRPERESTMNMLAVATKLQTRVVPPLSVRQRSPR